MSLTLRLLLLVALAVLPALLVGIYNEYELRRAQAEEVREHAATLAERTRAELRQMIEGVQRVAVSLAHVPVIAQALVSRDTASVAACTSLLANLNASYPGGLGVGVAAADGTLVCTASPVPPGAAVRGDHPRRAMESGGFVIGGYGAAPNGRGFLSFAYPLPGPDGAPAGALVLGIELDWLGQHLAARFGNQEAVVAVSDRDLIYLVRVPDDETQIVGKPGPAEWRQVEALTDKGPIEVRGIDGVNRVAVFLPLTMSPDARDRPDLLVAFGLSKDAAFARIDAATVRSTALLAASLLLAFAAAWFGGRRLVRLPVERLLAAAARWREGEWSARVGVRDAAEFGTLQAAFDEMAEHVEARTRALAASEQRLRTLSDLVPAFIWFGDEAGEIRYVNERWYAYTGRAREDGALGWRTVVHPDDAERAGARWAECVEKGIPLQLEVRLRDSEGTYRWFLVRADPVRDGTGRVTGWFGSSTDIEELKCAERHHSLLIDELNHRVKNTLVTVQSIAAQSLRAADPAVARRRFEERLFALARAHDLLTRDNWRSAPLREIVEEAVRPFRGDNAARVATSGPDVLVPPRLAVPLSMALHELLTNALKYGALSGEAGNISIVWSVEREVESERVRLRWQETDGPAVAPPSKEGFGSRLLMQGLARELYGTVDLRFDPSGVACLLEFPVSDKLEPAARPTRVKSDEGAVP